MPYPLHSPESIERNEFFVAKDEDVVGRLVMIRLEKGDTLPDVARHFSLGLVKSVWRIPASISGCLKPEQKSCCLCTLFCRMSPEKAL